MTTIESTGEKLTAKQREAAALRHIRHQLARIEAQLHVLGEVSAARYCVAAIKELEKG